MRTFFAMALMVMATPGCRPRELSPGPSYTLVSLERWHRNDPSAEHTMAGIITFHLDDRLPYWRELDPFCGAGYGNWEELEFRPASFGELRMQIADRGEVVWAYDGHGEAGWEAADGALAWDSGDTLRVVAKGGEAPAFEVEDVVPALVELTSIDLRAQTANQLHIPRSQPLDLRWAATQGDVFLLIFQFQATNSLVRRHWLQCYWPGASGGATVPTEVLGVLDRSTPDVNTNLYFGGGSRKRQTLEGIDLDVITWKNEVARIQID